MANQIVKYPKVGDHAVGIVGKTDEVQFITKESFDLASLDKSKYEVLGVVFLAEGREVMFCAPEEKGYRMCNFYEHKLSGYTLDGAARQFTLVYREKTDWNVNVEQVISYNATTKEQLVSQLETFFTTHEPFITQQWHAYLRDDEVILSYWFTAWSQPGNTSAKNGARLDQYTYPEIVFKDRILRRNGNFGGNGSVANYDRYVDYLRADNSSTSCNPVTIPANLRMDYPVCLPCYLGTSKYNSPSVEKCAKLREKYGEGEEGWLRHIMAWNPVLHTDKGAMKKFDSLAMTELWGSYKDYKGDYNCDAARYALTYGKTTRPAGMWCLPSVYELAVLMRDISYPDGSDIINDSLIAQGGSRVRTTPLRWSCGRNSTSLAWVSYGSSGYFSGFAFYGAFSVRPVSLYLIP